ncbi:unnamed protein product, partial [Coregonus sp. 'balchen']
ASCLVKSGVIDPPNHISLISLSHRFISPKSNSKETSESITHDAPQLSPSLSSLCLSQGRCTRDNCKYLHPPPHLKTQLEINGRNNLIQQKTAAAMLAQQMQFMLPGAHMSSLATSPSMPFSPYLSHMGPGMGLMPELLPQATLLVPGSPTSFQVMGNSSSQQNHMRTDKLEVCREFQRGNCTRGEGDCRYAHPMEAAMLEGTENSVIVCMDYIKGRCSRDKCKYFHPPAHLQARIKASQHQASQNTAVNAMLGICLKLLFRLMTQPHQR